MSKNSRPPRPRSRRQLRFHRQTHPGAAPGTVQVAPGAAAPQIGVLSYGPDRLTETEAIDLAGLPAVVAAHEVTWIDVVGLGDGSVLRKLGELFELHPLAQEDVVNVHQRSKVEPYEDLLFIVARMPDRIEDRFESEQLSIFLRKNLVVTFQERAGDSFDPIRDRIRRNLGRTRAAGADYLVYTLLDSVVDSYFPVLDRLGDDLERLEEDLTSGVELNALSRIHALRHELLMVRRSIRPHRDSLLELVRDHPSLMQPETLVFLRDCADHSIQLIELLEVYREICTDLRDYQLSLLSKRMNEVMKVLTLVATIFMPLSFIASLYGMNFDRDSPYNMPELGWSFGYPAVLTVMITVAIGMIVWYRTRGWVTHDDSARPRRE